jgi:single-strand DNA-binding protein
MQPANINHVVLTGSLTRDPELYLLPSGAKVCNLRLACNTTNQKAHTPSCKDKTNYFDVKLYGTHAATAKRSMHKGVLVAVDGRLDWREWETMEGHTAQTVSIIADAVQCLDDSTDSNIGTPMLVQAAALAHAV